ncbi:hypothetical protein [Streptomyces cinereoruber]|uniref:hypothetical protein n=1 Tax=Streptomyces cinereoruber TaxID=67260 RepID=UPI003635EF4A
MSKYQDSVPRILNLMKETFGGQFNQYFDGEPGVVFEKELPAIIVTQVDDLTEPGTFGQDDVTERIMVKILLNKKDDFQTSRDPENLTETKLRKIVGGRDPVTGHYEEQSVKGALRAFGTEGIVAIGRSVEVMYETQPRQDDVLTAEGRVLFSLQYAVDVEEAV